MSSIKNLNVIIVGGSVAGLSLANMLEKLGINFTLLEAYDTIAPQVGASIGLLGNGLRILDQLGCYEDLCKQAPDSLMSSTLRSKDRTLAQHQNLDPLIRGRLGYPFVFMDRQTLLQVLYENLEQKSKVHVAKRVVRVELLPGCVKVIAQDGTEWQGDIVVGADGIHSTIRSQMWQIAETLEPSYIPKDEYKKKQSKYACIFGISDPCGKWVGGDTSSIYREGFSYFIVGGPRRRVYWFLFFSQGGVKVGENIPRFTEKDRDRIARDHWDDVVDDNIKFGDLYAARRVAVLTSLEEVVFTKWHFKRIMTIGDAAHKLHPLGAQGGNSAIETAAALANGLEVLIKQRIELSEHVFDLMFKQVTDQRRDRVTRLMKKAHLRQSIEALDGLLPSFIALRIIPRLQSPRIFDRLYADTCAARKLDMLPTPLRSKQAPFHDEMLRVPRKTTKTLILTSVALLFIAAGASFFLHQSIGILPHAPGSFMKGQVYDFYCSTILFSFLVFWLC